MCVFLFCLPLLHIVFIIRKSRLYFALRKLFSCFVRLLVLTVFLYLLMSHTLTHAKCISVSESSRNSFQLKFLNKCVCRDSTRANPTDSHTIVVVVFLIFFLRNLLIAVASRPLAMLLKQNCCT